MRRTKKTKTFQRRVKAAVLDGILVHDHYTTNFPIKQDCSTGGQGMVTNGAGTSTLLPIMGDPQDLLNVCLWLRGFFGNIQRFYMRDERAQLVIKTATNTPCYFELTVWRCRKDLPITTDWPTLQAFYAYGLTNTGGTATVQNIGHTAFQNPLWCSYFKCIRKKVYILKPADMEKRLTFKNHKYKADYLQDGKFAQNLAFKGRTVLVMPRVWGCVMHDATNVYSISTAPAAVDMLWTYAAKTAYIEEAAHDAKSVSNLGGIVTPTVMGNNTNAGVTPSVV